MKCNVYAGDENVGTVSVVPARPVAEYNRTGLWDGTCTAPDCGALGARWWHKEQHAHYCDACATVFNLETHRPCSLALDASHNAQYKYQRRNDLL